MRNIVNIGLTPMLKIIDQCDVKHIMMLLITDKNYIISFESLTVIDTSDTVYLKLHNCHYSIYSTRVRFWL